MVLYFWYETIIFYRHSFKISITVEVKRSFLSQVKIISLYYCNFNNGANYLGIN